jgi:DNA polymerase-1
MPEGPKLLLIDGNNMAHWVFWANRSRCPDGSSSTSLSHRGKEVDMLFGFFRQLISLQKKYPQHVRVICWDRGYDRRLKESKTAVEAGLIPSSYKQPRKESQEDRKDDPDMVSFREQKEELKYGLKLIRCMEVAFDGIEADDIIYTYARHYADFDADCVAVSSDQDFLQILDENTRLYDPMKKELWTAQRFELEFGFKSHLWVDAGAIMGDKSDNIHGVDGWGKNF